MKMMTSLISIFMVIFLSSCSTIHLTADEQNITVKIASRHLGMEIARQCSEDVLQKIEIILNDIATVNIYDSETLSINLIYAVTKDILSELNNPLLEADCIDLIELIQNRIPKIGLETERVKLIQTSARAILQGIEIQENLNDE